MADGNGDRGQAFTLEGVAAAIVLLSGVLLAYQAIVLTPTTAGTVDRDVKSHLRTEAQDVLDIGHEEGELRAVALLWDASANGSVGAFPESNSSTSDSWSYTNASGYVEFGPSGEINGYGPPGRMHELLNDSFTEQGYVYNVYFDYRDAADPTTTRTVAVVDRGTPTDNAVTASVTVTLYDHMRLHRIDDAGGTARPVPTATTLADADGRFYAGDLSGPVYNVVTVRVVVW
ncbi:DUF7288 family protein [Halogeometricum luteum]|uniref:Flagellin N-terminal-like domain-containing protein n=1 Tax=Halogeometricum luteum TaxID=2950537 RepID=A0ABU2FX76_9EURY|nr:hypothetical protein [Halogeometricum sp. S3BR5-2]MDS0293145.1 hypothetical protein [Halogeometricum sp. S3BR5-2]